MTPAASARCWPISAQMRRSSRRFPPPERKQPADLGGLALVGRNWTRGQARRAPIAFRKAVSGICGGWAVPERIRGRFRRSTEPRNEPAIQPKSIVDLRFAVPERIATVYRVHDSDNLVEIVAVQAAGKEGSQPHETSSAFWKSERSIAFAVLELGRAGA